MSHNDEASGEYWQKIKQRGDSTGYLARAERYLILVLLITMQIDHGHARNETGLGLIIGLLILAMFYVLYLHFKEGGGLFD